MKPKIFFVIGVNGVGKSTVLPYLKALLSENYFDFHDFDERGVPDNADKDWRVSETIYWINLGKLNIGKGISTVICGFAKPEEIVNGANNLSEITKIIFLDADEKTIEERIKNRYQTEESVAELKRAAGKSVKKFTMDNIHISSILRKQCEDIGCKIINTNNRDPKDIAREIAEFTKKF